ncbi:MAG: ADP-forming succinate--CoA ligase subunit beta [Gammaproteobacteria bacterium]
MKLHEYQAKSLFKDYGIPTTNNTIANSAEQAVSEAEKLQTTRWVVKAQIHAGGRGKAGGVKIVDSLEEVGHFAEDLLATNLVTNQNKPLGQPVNTILIEVPIEIKHEFYLSALVERGVSKIVFIASVAGGMDIEDIAKNQPEKIVKVAVDPVVGLQAYQCRQLAFALELSNQIKPLSKIMTSMYKLIMDKDLAMIEINPLVLNADDEIIALDGKVTIDDNALYRQKALTELRDPSQDDEHENQAQEIGLNYVRLDGTIACMVNGAGLAMATMDLIKLHGGEPANFLDVGGGTSAEKVAEAFKLILSDHRVKSILVNIFGGIVRCDLIAEGIINAVKEVDIKVPVIVRLEGTNMAEGKELLLKSGLAIITAEDLTDAAKKAVHEAKK